MRAPVDRQLQMTVLGCGAVSHYIDLEAIATSAAVPVDVVAAALFSEVVTEDDAGTPRWVLKASTRRTVLVEGCADVPRWLDLVGPARSPTGVVLQAWLRGTLDVAVTLAHDEAVLRRVAGWLLDCKWLAPPVEVVLREIARTDLIRRLANAASGTFVGRTEELKWLATTIDGPTRCAVLEAKGGMGKSALLSRLLQQRAAFQHHGCFALLIDFDDPRFDVAHLDGLITELARQAAVQAPQLVDVERELQSNESSASAAQNTASERGLDDSRLLSLTQYLFQRMAALNRPAVLVLDTLERAVQRAPKLVGGILGQLRAMWSHHPGFTLIVSGRGPLELPEIADAPRLRLGPLTATAARELLVLLHVPPAHVERILARVPHTPLTLRLAARALEHLGSEALDDARLDEAIQRAQIDGYLQRRILSHLSTPRLSSVAELAFVLRSITPARLVGIIGPLVDPPLEPHEAKALFEELAKASDLVAHADGSETRLVLREEIADEITTLLRADRPAVVARVHERALAFLAGSTDEGDLDDLEFHSRHVEIPHGPEPWHFASARELQQAVPSLLASARFADALEIVETNPAARGDASLLLAGATAAKALRTRSRCRKLADLALAVATEPFDRARAHLLVAWASDAVTARAHRREARDLLPHIPGPIARRAEVIVGVADDRAWATDELRALFSDPSAWASLRGIDVDVIRCVCALLPTRESLEWAAILDAFHSKARVRYDTLARLAGVSAGELRRLQLANQLGGFVKDFLYNATPEGLLALGDVLEQMSTANEEMVVDVGERAKQLEMLATAIVTEMPADDWRAFAKGLGSKQIVSKAAGSDLGLVVRGTLNEIDRQGLGKRLVTELVDRGLHGALAVARGLWRDEDDES